MRYVKCYNHAMENAEEYVRKEVHRLYWDHDENCARTTLRILSVLMDVPVENQTLTAALGMHGAGGYGAQCGLVEGALMFLAIVAEKEGTEDIPGLCRRFASEFEAEFGSLRCSDLRPGGFSESDPPHRCEELTCRSILFAYRFAAEAFSSLMR